MGCKASRPQPKAGKARRRALSLEATTGNLRNSSDYRELVRTCSLKEANGVVSTEQRLAVDRAATYHDAVQDSSQKAMISSEMSQSMKAPPSTMAPPPVNPPLPTTTAPPTSQPHPGAQEPSGQSAQGPIVPVNLANIPHTPYPGLGQPAQVQQPYYQPYQQQQQQQQPRQQAIPVAVPTDANQHQHQHQHRYGSEFAKTVREHQRIAPLPAGATVPEYDYKHRNEPHQHVKEMAPPNRHRHRHHRRRKHGKHRRLHRDEDDTLYEIGTVMPEVDVDYNDDFYRRKGLTPQAVVATWGKDKPAPQGTSVGIREEAPKFTTAS